MSRHHLPRSWKLSEPAWKLGDRDTGAAVVRTAPAAPTSRRDKLRFRKAAFLMYASRNGLTEGDAQRLWARWRDEDRGAGRTETRGTDSIEEA